MVCRWFCKCWFVNHLCAAHTYNGPEERIFAIWVEAHFSDANDIGVVRSGWSDGLQMVPGLVTTV